ncbi:hypothetical protein L3Q70_04710 [Pseudoalteromonas sp. CF6-2]|uniref:hypothetical protein n=1 Tax=Pseudoalteromonas sp. CF6-2 TaxID=562716 RepID=UPI001880EA29|nr:hypothetical protein [Lelliottia steviae]UJX26461.1 hypothetical protein L3Q70_04710 [Pseudoalteromonas sp. CF6-2]|tara:strand:+ start:744 stop:1331 length:588 start_codon:yes stop_codon:yes gene_type:complete
MNANNIFPLPPDIAIAYFQLGLLSSTDLVTLADTWLNQGIYTDSINFLQMDKDPIMSEASELFLEAMEEMDVNVPTRVAAAWLVTEDIMERISSRTIDLMEGVNFIYWDVHHEIDTELPDGKYLGSNLKLEQVFCWLREVWDCRDGSRLICHEDLPRDEAEQKFLSYLLDECQKWLEVNSEQVEQHNTTQQTRIE